MKHLNFLSKSSSQSCGHSSVTLASTVGSPSVHRRGIMLKLVSVLVLILTFGVGQMWGAVTSPITLTTNSSTVGSSGQYTNKFDYKLTFTSVTAGGNNFVQNAKSSSIYNTVTIPGSITSIKLTDCATTSTKTDGGFTVYGGTTQANCTTEVASVSGLSSTAADKTVNFPGNYTFFKITVNSARVLKISSIVIYFSAANCSTDPTVGNIMNNVSGITANGATFSTSTGVSAGTNCTLSEVGFVYGTSTNPTITTGTKTTITSYTSGALNKSVTGLNPNTTYYVRAYAINGHGTTYSDEKSFSTPELPKYTITYNAGSGSCATSTWTQPSSGASTTLPTATPMSTCTGWSFAGWCTSSAGSADENSASPGTILTGSYQPTSDVTLYAIYKRTVNSGGSASLTKMVTGNTLSDGDKLVVVASGDYSDVAMYQETTNSSYVETWDCSTLNATTVGADSKRWWTVTATTGGFYLGDDTNGYLNMSSNNLYCSEDQSVWTLSDLEDGTFKLQSGSRNLSYRHDTQASKWRMGGTSYGNSGQTVLDLYKYSAGGGSTTYYMTSLVCCTELAQINGSINVNNATSVTLQWDAVTGAEKYQVKVPGSSSHDKWTDVNTTSVTVTKSCGTAYTAYFRAIDTNGSHCSEGPESTLAIPAQSWTVTSSGVTNATASPAIPAITCDGFSTTITAATGYALPAEITVTNADKTWNSSTGALTISNVTGDVTIIIAGTCITPNITADPASAVYSLNESATPLSVTVEGAGAWCGYQWESKVGNGNWTPIQNATSSSYTPSTASAGSSTLYHVIVSNVASGCSTSSTSEAATILVSALPVCASPTFSEAAGTKLGAQSITLSCEDGDATIYYTTNGDDPQEIAADLYDGSVIAVNQTTTIKAIAAKSGTTTSAVVSATYTIQCKAPTANVSAGTYNVEKSVELSSEYGTVYYTTDGSDPASGSEYNGAIAVSQTTTIRAIAKRANCENSEEFSATYTLKCATPTFSVAAGTHTGAQDVELSCATDGAAIHYTTNGNDPTGSSPTYSEAITVSSAQTIKAIATKSGWSNSDIAEAAYTIQYAVKWYVGGTEEANVVSTTYVNAGSNVAPIADREGDAIGTCATDFMGWTTEALRNGSVPQTADHYTTLFKYENASASLPTISEATSYYAVFAKEGTGKVTVTDELTCATTGVTSGSTTYTAWSNKKATNDAVYAGKSAGGNDAIQLRTTNSEEGIVTTTSGGKAKKVTVVWNSNTTSGRTINIYGKNSAYSEASDLYDNNNQGTLLGSIVYNTSTELTITGDYEFIGIRSNSGALYLDKVDIQWETTGTTLTDYVTECPAVVAPTFDTAEGTYNAAQTVKISNYNSDYLYFYTTDNSDPAADANLDPTGTSAVYDNATGIAINGSCTLKAVAYNEDVVASAINSAAYVLKVATPEISGSTSFVNSATVTITATGADAIYYTDDDSDPANSGTKKTYSAPFSVESTKTIKAIATKANWTSSEIASQAFTKITPSTVASALTSIAALQNNGTIADQYVKGLISEVDKFNSDNTITYYISDDGTTTSQLQVYHGSAGVANGGNAFSAADNLQVGEEVIVSGTLKKYVSGNKTTPEFVNPNEIVAYKTHSPIAWSANAYTAELGGSENEFPTLSGTTGLTISYSSSDETVATISADGTTYDLKKTGETTITATSAATDDFVATTKSYTLTVSPTVIRVDLDIDCNGATSGCPETTHLVKQTSLPNPLPEVTKTGKNFGGWYTDNTFETPAVAGAALTENTTLYAQWLDPYTVAEALTIISGLGNDEKTADNVYVAGVVTADAVSIDNNNTATYKIKDATVNNSLEVYKGKGLNNADVAVGDLQEGDQVVVYGQLMKYKGNSSTAKPEIVNPNHLYSKVRPTVDVTGVSVSPTSTNTRVGRTVELTKTIQPANASDKAVTWSSDAEGVATVDENGVVTGVAEGTAHITVTTHDGGFQATCTVTVAGALPTFTEDDHEWIKITNASKLVAGRFYVIGVGAKGVTATNDLSSGYLDKVSSTFSEDKSVIASGDFGANTAIFELGGNSTDGWTLYELTDEENTGYLSGTNTSSLSWSASAATTSISFDESGNAILGNANGYRVLYNSSSPRFKGYDSNTSSSMLLPQLYMWAELSHSVTFDANGGVAESVPNVERTDEGKIIIPATTPTHSDISKAFGGWYKSDAPSVLYNAGDEFETNVDVTLYAKWNTVPTYTVTYVPGGAGTVPAVASYREGQKVQVEEASLSNPGYSFAGWTVKDADQNVLPLDEENKFEMPASNVTITAVWSRISSQKWNLVKYGEALEIDAEYVIAYNSTNTKKALSSINTSGSTHYGNSVEVTIDGEVLKGSELMKTLTLKAGNGGSNYAFKNGDNYLTWSSGNSLDESETLDNASSWTINIDENDVATISNVGESTRKLQYNTGSPRFACYTGSQKNVQLYKKAASVVINNGETVEAAGITANADVTIKNGGTLNVDADKQIGDLTVENGGKVTLSSNKLTVVGTFTIETTMASGASGQLNGATESNFEAQEDAYIDITLGDNGNPEKWHAFTVPFPVDAINGIYDLDGNKLVNEVNYAIMDYHGDIRATGKYGWKKFRGVLVPGTFYLMTVDGERTTYRFKKTANGALVAGNTKQLYEYASTTENNDNGWNGVGNPTLMYGTVDQNVQVLNPVSYTYEPYTAGNQNFVVGTPFFVQTASDGTMTMSAADGSKQYYAPARQAAKEIKDVKVTFGNEEYTDKLYISASEDALNEYETGKDLAKMTMTSTPKVAQIFGKAYNAKLCMVYAPMANDQAVYDLTLYAPKAGEYTIAAPNVENADLYLTYEGSIIWDLSMGEYINEFAKGNNEGYGLLLQAKMPMTPTGVDEVQSDKVQCTKVVIDEHVYILRGGQMYDVTGKAVK